MVPPNNLGPDLNGKAVNETQYRGFDLKGYSDSDYAGCNMDRKSTSGACQLLGGKLMCWSAKKQQSVAMSSAKAEYVAATGCCANILWIKSQLTDYDIIYEKVSDACFVDCEFWYTAKTLDDSKIWVSTPTGGIRGNIGINTFRNALRAHYLPHSSMYVSPPSITIVRPWFATIGYSGEIGAKGTLKKSFLPPKWRLLMGQIIQCLGGKTCGLDQISNKDATILYCLANRVKVDYAKLIWEDIIHKLNKKIKEKVVPYPRFISLLLEYMMPKYDNEELTINPTKVFSVHNWALKPNQTEGPPFTDHMKAICNLDVHVDSKTPKPSSQTKEVPQGKNPGAKSGLRRKQSSSHTSESKTEASKSKTGQSKKETQSMSAKDKSPSHPSPPTLVVGEMHKEAQQAASGPPSLGATSEEGAHPQLNSGTNPSVLVDQTKSIGDGLKTTHIDSGTNEESRANEISKKIKLEDLSYLLKDTRSVFFTPDSPQDELIIVSDESEEEEEVDKDKDTHATSHDVPEETSIPHPPSLKLAQIQELMAQVQLLQSQKDELEQHKAKAKAEVASLKARPSYPDVNQLTDLLVTSLKPEFSKLLDSHDFTSCLPNALKELPSKLTKLFGEIKELKKHVQDMKIELLGDLKEIPTKLETFTSTISSLSSQEKIKTLDYLPSLLAKVTDTLNKFVTVVENASMATTKDVPSPGQPTASSTEWEKNTNPATTDAEPNLHDELVDLLVIDVVTQYYNKKLLYDKYCDKMLKRRKSSKITNCDVLTQKSPISLKVHREYGTIEVISNVKVSDLHLAEWRETRMEYLDQTEKELKIEFNKPLKEQDPMNELNDLANKKRKRTGDSTDHSSSSGPLKIGKYLHFSVCSGTETEEGLLERASVKLV
ncbi:hypothetical protein Tco_1359880 [Tanacetum coccineum]